MTTPLVIKITADDIDVSKLGDVDAGLSDGLGLVGDEFFIDLREFHPATAAWDALLEDVAQELKPQIETMLVEAIHRRLPFEWVSDEHLSVASEGR